MVTLGAIPPDLQAAIQRWITNARANDPNKLCDGDSLIIVGGPAYFNSITTDGSIWTHDYSDNPPRLVMDGAAKIETVVAAGRRRPEFLMWLPQRPKLVTDCADCTATGWQRFGDAEFVCKNCSGLGWIASA